MKKMIAPKWLRCECSFYVFCILKRHRTIQHPWWCMCLIFFLSECVCVCVWALCVFVCYYCYWYYIMNGVFGDCVYIFKVSSLWIFSQMIREPSLYVVCVFVGLSVTFTQIWCTKWCGFCIIIFQILCLDLGCLSSVASQHIYIYICLCSIE